MATKGAQGLAALDGFERWWEEHSDLDHLVAALEESLSGGRIAVSRRAVEELAGALETHFDLEERVYFPLVERFSPEHCTRVRAARVAHAQVSETLQSLCDLIERGETLKACRVLAVLLDRFRTHEIEDARLIADLERGRVS
ncbi:MAG: hemerythrin domain-containing protein [Deltaproteobacteria bacterium]|nr:hemerythrin domain-containing protein [Deltaproteobacteria bacterium]